MHFARTFVICAFCLLTACGKTHLTPHTVVNTEDAVGIKGFDPVAYHTAEKAVQGKPGITTKHNGVTYRFASQETRTLFEAKPEQYLPAYGGYCAYAMSQGNIVDINPRNWTVEDGQLYLNANIFAQGLWLLNKEGHIERADKNWAALINKTAP